MTDVFVGIDVGQSRHHVAVVDAKGALTSYGVPSAGYDTNSAVALVRELTPACVAIDAPREPAHPGSMSRACERDVQRTVGCRIFPTPDAERLAGHWGEGWTRAGFELFRALEHRSVPHVVEVFPTATRTVWAGARPAGAGKARWSDHVCRLYAASLTTDALLPARWNQHQRDALTAAWTARLIGTGAATELTGGAADPGIWIPTEALPNL